MRMILKAVVARHFVHNSALVMLLLDTE